MIHKLRLWRCLPIVLACAAGCPSRSAGGAEAAPTLRMATFVAEITPPKAEPLVGGEAPPAGTPAGRDALAGRLYQGLVRSIDGIRREPVSPIQWKTASLRLSPRSDEQFTEAAARRLLADASQPEWPRTKAALTLAWRDRFKAGRPVEVNCLHMGSLRMLSLPGDTFVEYQLWAQQRCPDKFVDEAACKETETQFPGVVTARVKRAKSRDLCEGPDAEAARRLTARKVAEAIGKLRSAGFAPYKPALPLRVTVRMASEELAAAAAEKPGLRRIDRLTFECQAQRQCDVNKTIYAAGLAMAPPRQPRPQTPPNVLLLITDQQRWDTLGYTGKTPCRTPNLDRLVREGIALDRCLTSAPLCAPARAALFTGRYPGATGVPNNVQPRLERPTLLEVFRDAGYDVAYSGKWHLGRGRGAAAIPAWPGEREAYQHWLAEQGFPDTSPYGKPSFAFYMPGTQKWISSPRTAVEEGPAEHTYDAWIAAQALENLEKRPPGKPFFHVCSFWGPHPIFVIPEPYYSMYDPTGIPEPANFADAMQNKPRFQTHSIWHEAARAHGTTWEPWRKSLAVYWGYVTWLDTLIGRLLQRLDALGLANDTIVIVTSDHGEQMGSHGIFQKCCMYEESLRVPLLIRAPGRISAGRRLAAPVSHVDLAPTLMRLCGVAERGFPLLEPQGRDLSGWLTDAEPDGEQRDPKADPTAGAVFSQYSPDAAYEQMTELRCVIGPRYKYAWNRQDVDELYDTWADPAEFDNRASDPALRAARQTMRGRLQEWLDSIKDPYAAELAGEGGKQK